MSAQLSFRFALSRKAINRRICPPPLYAGLGASPHALSSRRRDLRWVAEHPHSAFRYRLRPSEPPPVGLAALPWLHSISFSLAILPIAQVRILAIAFVFISYCAEFLAL